MLSVKLQAFRWFASALAMLCVLSVNGIAQTDPDPNSPEPILLTQKKSARALASTEKQAQDLRAATERSAEAFEPATKVVLYATNFDFLPGEGANSIRVYAADKKGRQFRFPVLGLESIKSDRSVFAVTILLSDEIRSWSAPDNGDLLIYLTWRGLASNQAWFGFGELGGWKTDTDIIPAPLRTVSKSKFLPPAKEGPTSEYIGYRWSGDRKRFVEQATFGPTDDQDMHIRRHGIRRYIEQQLTAAYPSTANPYPNQPLKPGNAPSDCDGDNSGLNGNLIDVPLTCFRDTYTQYQPQTWFLREAFYGDAQLRHRVAWALSQIWVTSGVDIQQGRHMVEWHKVLSANAFGNYRQLMEQMTMNPTMGDYLDMVRSTKNNPNENYARELKQLFTIGLFMMNPDGTLILNQGEPIPTYDQNVVNNFTKVLTGWNFCNNSSPGVCPNIAVGTVNFIDPVLLISNNHDLTAKTLLSYPGSTTTNIAACSNCSIINPPNPPDPDIAVYANNSMDQALDNIFYHPNLGPYIGRTLIQQMVTSDPTPAYIGRVAAAFANNGSGVRGDMKAVIRAILLDPEARGDVKTDPNFGKLREPILFTTNFARTFGVRSASGTGLSDGYFTGRGEFTGMGQTHFRSPTVFNYYPPDNVIPGTTLLGPEFAIMTTGTSIQRANFINRMVFTTIPIAVSDPNSPMGTSFDFNEEITASNADATGNALMDLLNSKMMHGTMSATMRASIRTAVITNIASTNGLGRARQAIYLVATSSQYQVQR